MKNVSKILLEWCLTFDAVYIIRCDVKIVL